MKDTTTIEDLLAVYPSIRVVSELDFCKEILEELLEECGGDTEKLSRPHTMKWEKYFKEYSELGGKMEDLKVVK